MRIALFCHSLLSNWNHRNAHFLRGMVWELKRRGHHVDVFEPEQGWSLSHLVREFGRQPIDDFYRADPGLDSIRYDLVPTYGGGEPVIRDYRRLGATKCVPIYNALDPDTHFRVSPELDFARRAQPLGPLARRRERAARAAN